MRDSKIRKEAISQTLNAGGAFVLLASTPVPEIQREFEEIKELYRDNPQVLMLFEYNEELAH
jgi:glycogen synthase